MIECCLKKCCLNCPHPDIEVRQYLQHYGFDKFPEKDAKIFCRHEPVCKAYGEETEVLIDANAGTNE